MCLSDIVRDYTLAARTAFELQQLQQSFIRTLIASIAAKSGGSQSHTILYSYGTNSLAYHVRAALSAPFAADGLAASLLLNKDASIIASVSCKEGLSCY